jgi:hypothetical protein
MSDSTLEQLRLPPAAGLSARGDFDGGTLSSDSVASRAVTWTLGRVRSGRNGAFRVTRAALIC